MTVMQDLLITHKKRAQALFQGCKQAPLLNTTYLVGFHHHHYPWTVKYKDVGCKS